MEEQEILAKREIFRKYSEKRRRGYPYYLRLTLKLATKEEKEFWEKVCDYFYCDMFEVVMFALSRLARAVQDYMDTYGEDGCRDFGALEDGSEAFTDYWSGMGIYFGSPSCDEDEDEGEPE